MDKIMQARAITKEMPGREMPGRETPGRETPGRVRHFPVGRTLESNLKKPEQEGSWVKIKRKQTKYGVQKKVPKKTRLLDHQPLYR